MSGCPTARPRLSAPTSISFLILGLIALLTASLAATPAAAQTAISTATFWREWPSAGLGSEMCGMIVVDENVYLLNGQTGVVTVTDQAGRPRGSWSAGISGYNSTDTPNLLSKHRWARAGMSALGSTVFVADPAHGRIRYADSYNVLHDITGDIEGTIQLQRPVAISQGRYGIRVLDAGSGLVVAFNSDWTLRRTWPATGTDGAPVHLVDITEDEEGNTYVADAGTGRIHRFGGDGSYHWSFGGLGTSDGQFENLTSIMAIGGGLCAADGATNRLQVFDHEGQHLVTCGNDPTSGLSSLLGPVAVSVNPTNQVFVTDGGHGRIAAFELRTPGKPLQVEFVTLPAPPNGVEPLTVRFKATLTGGWQPYHFSWSFGDGTTGEGVEVSHRYLTPGSYVVTLTAGDSSGPPMHVQADRTVDVTPRGGEPPRIILHVVPQVDEQPACASLTLTDPAQAIVSAGLTHSGDQPYLVYLLVDRHATPSIAGLQCGLMYGSGIGTAQHDLVGVDILEWHLCADLEFPTEDQPAWPAAGTGNLITWDSTVHCQTGALAVAGYFVVTARSEDMLRVVPRPADAVAAVADCDNVEYFLGADQLGYVAFSEDGKVAGFNPAGHLNPGNSTPVRPTTWSGIKGLFSGQ